MEDFYDAKSSQIEGKVISLFGIFDGTSLSLSFCFKLLCSIVEPFV